MRVATRPFFKVLSVSILTLTLPACATSHRTAEGECYYSGKGVLQVLGTVGDAYVQYHEAEAERRYQHNQIERQQIAEELAAVDFGRINYEYSPRWPTTIPGPCNAFKPNAIIMRPNDTGRQYCNGASRTIKNERPEP